MAAERTIRLNRTGAATRRKIVEAAIAVLAERGFSGFTLQAVADRAGVLFGSVTHHYGTRDRLIEAMLDAILEGYRSRFVALASAVRADGSPVRALVTFLIDDAVDPKTAGIFLELWAMATYLPPVAKAVNALYDDAIDACIEALGIPPRSAGARRLRELLYVLGTVVEEPRRSSPIATGPGGRGARSGTRPSRCSSPISKRGWPKRVRLRRLAPA